MSSTAYPVEKKKACCVCGKQCEFTFNVHPQAKVYCRDCWAKKETGVPNLRVLFSIPGTLADWPWGGAEKRYDPSLHETWGENPPKVLETILP